MAATITSQRLLAQLNAAMNQHDLDALGDCFHLDYDSDFPAHPARAFRGQEQMRRNWSQIFAWVPDLCTVLVRSTADGDTAWAEWEWSGTHTDGHPFLMRGVTIQGIRDDRFAWVRLYMEQVEDGGGDPDSAHRRAIGEPATI